MVMCHNRRSNGFWPYRMASVEAAIAFDNIHIGRGERPDGAIEKFVDMLLEFADGTVDSPLWVCMYADALKTDDKKMVETVKELRALVREKAREMIERKDPVALRKLCLRLHDEARRSD